MCNKMSDVRLSNASPTVERVDARQPDNVRPPVRRNLFGSPDREGLRRYFETAMQEGVRDFREQYNYDPVDDRPLTPRNYDWEPDDEPAEFYLRPPHGSQPPQRDEDSSAESNRQDAAESSAGQPDRQPDRDGTRKRRSEDSGRCSDECQSKRSREENDDDEDDDQSGASPAVRAAEERPSRPENSAAAQ